MTRPPRRHRRQRPGSMRLHRPACPPRELPTRRLLASQVSRRGITRPHQAPPPRLLLLHQARGGMGVTAALWCTSGAAAALHLLL